MFRFEELGIWTCVSPYSWFFPFPSVLCKLWPLGILWVSFWLMVLGHVGYEAGVYTFVGQLSGNPSHFMVYVISLGDDVLGWCLSLGEVASSVFYYFFAGKGSFSSWHGCEPSFVTMFPKKHMHFQRGGGSSSL